jgi:hypothetical protein
MNEAAHNSLSRVVQHFDKNSFAIISASRGIYSAIENSERTEELKEKVRAAGYGFVKMRGKYIEGFGTDTEKKSVEEDVLFIASRPMAVISDDMTEKEKDKAKQINNSRNGEFKSDMLNFGNEFDQESILFKPYGERRAYLIGAIDHDENGVKVWPGKGNEVVAGDSGELKPMQGGMFSTIMWKNKKHFKFESVENSKSFFGSWSDFLHKKMILENKSTR